MKLGYKRGNLENFNADQRARIATSQLVINECREIKAMGEGALGVVLTGKKYNREICHGEQGEKAFAT